jgi:hypothetical protein
MNTTDATPPPALPASWAFPTTSARKCHYFPEGGTRSLCGKYALLWGLRPPADGSRSPDDCVVCRRRLDKAET